MSDEKKTATPSRRILPGIPSQIKPNVSNNEQKSETTEQPEHIATILPSIEILPTSTSPQMITRISNDGQKSEITKQTGQVICTLPQNEAVISHFENEVNMSQFEKAYLQLLSVGRFALSREEFLPIFKQLYNTILTDLSSDSNNTTNSTPPTIKDKIEEKDGAPMKRGGGSTGRGNRAPKAPITKYRESATESNENSSIKTPKKINTGGATLDMGEIIRKREEMQKRKEANLNNTNNPILDESGSKEKEIFSETDAQKTLFPLRSRNNPTNDTKEPATHSNLGTETQNPFFNLRKTSSPSLNNTNKQSTNSNSEIPFSPSKIKREQEKNQQNNSSILPTTPSRRALPLPNRPAFLQSSETKVEENKKDNIFEQTSQPQTVELPINTVTEKPIITESNNKRNSFTDIHSKLNITLTQSNQSEKNSHFTIPSPSKMAPTEESKIIAETVEKTYGIGKPIIALVNPNLLLIEFNPALSKETNEFMSNMWSKYSATLYVSDLEITVFSIQNQGETLDQIDSFVKKHGGDLELLYSQTNFKLPIKQEASDILNTTMTQDNILSTTAAQVGNLGVITQMTAQEQQQNQWLEERQNQENTPKEGTPEENPDDSCRIS